MKETIHIASEAVTWFAGLVFLAIAAGIGYAVYALLARPETRRVSFRGFGAASRPVAASIAIFLSATIFSLICWSLLTGFSRIRAQGEVLRLHFLLPPREVQIRRDEVRLLEKKFTHKVSWRLSITTTSGEVYESRSAASATIEAARLRLAQLAAE